MRHVVISAMILAAVCRGAAGQDEAKPPTIKIRVEAGDWGGAPTDNIEAVCRSVAKELTKHFPGRTLDPIVVRPTKGPPMAVFGKNDKGERRVLLPARGSYWSQFAYQFAHEQCHILCNYREVKNPNLWLEECFCEAASIYAIRRMAETWKSRPPYPNWKNYASSLDQYVTDHVRTTRGLDGDSPGEWVKKNEKTLRVFDRGQFQTVAVHVLLPRLEKDPSHWQALESLNGFDPAKELTFEEHLIAWRRRAPERHRAFLADLANAFGVKVE